MFKYYLICIVFYLLLFSGCASYQKIQIPQTSTIKLPHSGSATASAISVDITPPPGLPMGGYSVMANYGQGFRTRIKARIIYLNNGKGASTALVQTDLTSASLLLHHKVASEVAKRTGLRPGDIAITASHSHSAPANIFNNDFYNRHMSNDKGLSLIYLNFLVKQISQGIIRAFELRRPAKISTGSKNIYGYNRNRSIDAYLRNKNVNIESTHRDELIFKAVNPALNMIRIDVKNSKGQYLPLAAFSSFSVHATAISPQVTVYNADLFAYAQKDLEWAIKEKYNTPWPIVHGLTTGTQGDMAPALKRQGDNYIKHFDLDWQQAKILGKNIAKEAIQLFESLESNLQSNIELNNSIREIDIRKSHKIQEIEICQNPAIGSPVASGAFERRTPWLTLIPFFRAGNIFSHSWFFNDGCQGNKDHLGFSFIQSILEPKSSFPHIVMFQSMRINDVLLLPLPFEVTHYAGLRIRNQIQSNLKKSTKQAIKHLWVTSNANGYFGYSTTMEEYGQQNYEGGHTIYGKYTTPYLGAQLSKLISDSSTKTIHTVLPNWQYKLAVNKFFPESKKSMGQRKIFQKITQHNLSSNNVKNYVAFQWIDVNPSEINFHEPLASVEKKIEQQWRLYKIGNQPISDEGYDVEIRYLDEYEQAMGRYEIRWYNPQPGDNYRFVIEKRQTQKKLFSNIFSYRFKDKM